MIRNATLVTLLTAAALGLILFALKYKVQALEETYTELNRAIIDNRQALHVLRAEWSHLNEPQRLQALAARHLDLKPVLPANVGSVAALPPERQEAGPMIAMPAEPAPVPDATKPHRPRAAEATAPPSEATDDGGDDFARIISQALADRRSSR